MELRTTFSIEPSPDKITYHDPVMFIGSCFASSIGSQMGMGHMPVMINPAGAVFNPVSVCNTLDSITRGKEFIIDDLHFHDDNWLSFYHYTDFSSEDSSALLEKINRKSKEAFIFLKKCHFLFVTLGTAMVYKWKKSDLIVSNCHKIPADQFESKLLTVDDIVTLWTEQLNKLHFLFPQLQVVFTISPIRHWKNGAHGNQVSKSILFVAVDELLKHKTGPKYFPAYELVMDDLRDYRFYSDDMLHPSGFAINYIWEAFAGCYMDNKTINLWKEVVKITKACNHSFKTDSEIKKKYFAESILKQISDIKVKLPEIDLSMEQDYFLKMRKP
jgi:GSCFA family